MPSADAAPEHNDTDHVHSAHLASFLTPGGSGHKPAVCFPRSHGPLATGPTIVRPRKNVLRPSLLLRLGRDIRDLADDIAFGIVAEDEIPAIDLSRGAIIGLKQPGPTVRSDKRPFRESACLDRADLKISTQDGESPRAFVGLHPTISVMDSGGFAPAKHG